MTWWAHIPSKSQLRSRVLKDFSERQTREEYMTTHSARGESLLLLISRLEAAGVPYTLDAIPGKGYALTSHPERKVE